MSAALHSLLSWLVANPGTIVTAAFAVVAMVKGQPWLDAKLAEHRTQQIMQLAHVIFHSVEDVAKAMPAMDPAAKVAMFLDQLVTAAEAAGLGQLSTAEKALAVGVAQATSNKLTLATAADVAGTIAQAVAAKIITTPVVASVPPKAQS